MNHALFSRFKSFELEITRNALLSLIRNGLVLLGCIIPLEIGREFSLPVVSLLVNLCLALVNLNPLDRKNSKLVFDLDLNDD